MDNDKQIRPIPVAMPEPCKDYELKEGQELRISNIIDHIKVLLISGRAEVFGMELPQGEPMFFNQTENIAIFCWK